MIVFAAALAAQAAPPARTEVPFEAARVTGQPNASVRHALLAGGPAIPADGIAFTARCLVSRRNGRSFSCETPDTPEQWRRIATALASLYQFDLSGLQLKPDENTLSVTIVDRLVPADVRPPDRLFRYTAPAAGEVVFAAGLSTDQFAAYFPVSALRANDEASINVDCQVQPDLGLFCLNARPATGSPPTASLGAFALATYQLMGAARVAPALDNGAPAAGIVFRRTLNFRIPVE